MEARVGHTRLTPPASCHTGQGRNPCRRQHPAGGRPAILVHFPALSGEVRVTGGGFGTPRTGAPRRRGGPSLGLSRIPSPPPAARPARCVQAGEATGRGNKRRFGAPHLDRRPAGALRAAPGPVVSRRVGEGPSPRRAGARPGDSGSVPGSRRPVRLASGIFPRQNQEKY